MSRHAMRDKSRRTSRCTRPTTPLRPFAPWRWLVRRGRPPSHPRTFQSVLLDTASADEVACQVMSLSAAPAWAGCWAWSSTWTIPYSHTPLCIPK